MYLSRPCPAPHPVFRSDSSPCDAGHKNCRVPIEVVMGNSVRTLGACDVAGLLESRLWRQRVLLVPAPDASRECSCFCLFIFMSSIKAAFTRGSPTWLRSFSRRARRFDILDSSPASFRSGALRRRAWACGSQYGVSSEQSVRTLTGFSNFVTLCSTAAARAAP